jgi:phosphoribosylamine--glycine ligase
MRKKAYGDGSNRVILEEPLHGKRISLVAIADEKTILPLASVSKFRALPGKDEDPDAEVYSSCSPAPFATKEIEKDIMDKVMFPVQRALNSEGIVFRGFISADLLVQKDGIYLSELQFGFGDLETQLIMPGLDADIGELILSASEGRLPDIRMKEDLPTAFCLTLFSKKKRADGGKGSKIKGLDAVRKMEEVFVFHENTVFEERDVHTPGGTVLYVTGIGADLKEAQTRAYSAAAKIHFQGLQYKKIPERM